MHGLLSDHFLRKFTLWYKPQNPIQNKQNKKNEKEAQKQKLNSIPSIDGENQEKLVDEVADHPEP